MTSTGELIFFCLQFLFGDRAVEIIYEEAEKEGPYFLYLALQNIHTPRQVRFIEKRMKKKRSVILVLFI